MDQRKSLHGKLSQNEAALLEWESVASWLASDALVSALQTTLAKEVEIYLEWSTYVCLNVLSAPQTAKYLLAAPLRDLLQVRGAEHAVLTQPRELTAGLHRCA